jgi:hypothetical protein
MSSAARIAGISILRPAMHMDASGGIALRSDTVLSAMEGQ